MYKIKKLVEDNFDFLVIFPEKQESVRNSSGLDFDLSEIVSFLQKQTNNFTIDNVIAHDLDDAIFNVYEQYKKEFPSAVPEPAVPEPAVPEADERQEREDMFDKADVMFFGDESDVDAASLNFNYVVIPALIEKSRGELIKMTKSKKSISDEDLTDKIFDIIKNDGVLKTEIRELYLKN